MLLKDSVDKIPLIGNKYVELLLKLEITSIEELLYYFPRSYTDTSVIVNINELSRSEVKTTIATIEEISNIRTKNRKSLQKGIITDGSDSIEVIWFNQPFLTRNLKPGMEVMLAGKLSDSSIKPQLVAPQYEVIRDGDKNSIHLGRISPNYPLTKGITAKWLRSRIHYIIDNINQIEDLDESLPDWMLEKYNLTDIIDALECIHFPENTEEIAKSRRRLGFEELVEIQIKLINEHTKRLESKAVKVSVHDNSINEFISSLPFELTSTQKIAYQEIHSDYSAPYPMKRLIQGDVGSGKTIVAALAALPVLESSKQVVLLAPTAVLAEQHFESFLKYFGDKFKIGLITSQSSAKEKKEHYDLVIGTHAILHHKDTLLDSLGLLIVDEEHRFGVKQRRELGYYENHIDSPHILHLTATPIPRTLALTLFGNFDVSVIEKPSQRVTVATSVVPEDKREDSYAWIRNLVNQGGQVFWIFPLIDENEEMNANALEEKFPVIKKIFKEFNV
ncbi:DEAD/DEAH box helicase family protein, partial [Candidatus Dojkabacteria bacterium]|nr:DEAD/DEAH box helicase family protein [Candidatus Dojkabacteria bacterium]